MTGVRSPRFRRLFTVLAMLGVAGIVGMAAGCSDAEQSETPTPASPTATAVSTSAPPSDGALAASTPGAAGGMFGEIETLLSPTIPALSGVAADESASPDWNKELGAGEPYRIGGVVTESIDGIAIQPGVCAGAEARIAGASQRAELRRSIEWLGCIDDGGDVDQYRSAMDRLLFANPFALVPLTSEHFLSGDELTSAGVIHAGVTEQPAYCGLRNRFGFAVSGAARCPVLSVSGITTAGPVLRAWLSASGGSGPGLQVGVVVNSAPSGQETLDARALEIETAGAVLTIADQRLLPGPGNPEEALDQLTADLIAAAPDVIFVEVDDAPRLFVKIRAAGFEGDLVGVRIDPVVIGSNSQAQGQYRNTWQVIQGVSLLSDGAAGWQQLAQDAGLLGSAEPVGLGFVRGYVAVDFLVAALVAAEDGPASPAAVHDLINTGWEYPGIAGLACPSDWPVAHLAAVPCASVVRADADGGLRPALAPTVFDLLVDPER